MTKRAHTTRGAGAAQSFSRSHLAPSVLSRLLSLVLLLVLTAVAPITWAQDSRYRLPDRADARALEEKTEPFRLPTATEREAQQRLRALAPEALESVIQPEEYVLGPHDVLAVMLMLGEVRFEQVPVLPEGVVLVPSVGAVHAAGRTLREFRQALHEAVSQRYQNFELYCYLAETRRFRVYVTGEVLVPGTFVARPYERVSDLIERAAGFTEDASRRAIELRNIDGELLSRVDLGAFYARGDLAGNPGLTTGQVIFVPPRKREIEVVGAVGLPGTYELRAGDTLDDILALAGGPTEHADLGQVSVDTVDRDGHVHVRRYDIRNAAPQVEGVVRVSVLSKRLGQRRVFAIMPDDEQYTLHLSEGETLQDLVRRAGALDLDADLEQARLSTHDDNGKRVVVSVDIAKVLRGEDDRPLRDGDVLSIPNVRDYVYVSGYVTRPGRYLYRADWTISDYLGEAGGTIPGGNRKSASVLGKDGVRKKMKRSESLRQGDTIYLDRSTSGKLVTILAVFTNISALVISVVALSRR